MHSLFDVESVYDSGYMDRILFSYERVFHTAEVVNKHNAKAWGGDKPYIVIEVPYTSQKLIVWSDMHKTKILDTCFFSEPATTGELYNREASLLC